MREVARIIFFGDIVGKVGRITVRDFIAKNQISKNYDFVIANVENASHGFGLTKKNYNELKDYGINVMTSGNHIWDKKEIFEYINEADYLVRPLNYPNCEIGLGSRIIEHNGIKVGVLNFLGRVFMTPMESPWNIIKDEVEKLKKETPIIIVDYHAEATAEKVCFGKYCASLGVSAFFGTHTHIQTADERIENGMAYITDAGFCGASDGVIGMDYQTSLNRFLTCMPERYEVAEGKNAEINAVEVEIDLTTGHALAIRRILYSRDNNEDKESEEKV